MDKLKKKKKNYRKINLIIAVAAIVLIAVLIILFMPDILRGKVSSANKEKISKEDFEKLLAVGLYKTQPKPRYILQAGVRLEGFDGINRITVFFVPNSTVVNREDLLNIAGFVMGSILTGFREFNLSNIDTFNSVDAVTVKAMDGYTNEFAEFRADAEDIEEFWFARNITEDEFKDRIKIKWNID